MPHCYSHVRYCAADEDADHQAHHIHGGGSGLEPFVITYDIPLKIEINTRNTVP